MMNDMPEIIFVFSMLRLVAPVRFVNEVIYRRTELSHSTSEGSDAAEGAKRKYGQNFVCMKGVQCLFHGILILVRD